MRRAEISAGLAAVRARIAAACQAAGRSPAAVTLIAITKTRPASDIRLLSGLGVTDIGENRAQEAAAKAAECAALGLRLTWHFVGQLQVNKAASVTSYADVIHSVDRLRLVSALGSRARAAGRRVTCLVQVSLDGDPARGGDDFRGNERRSGAGDRGWRNTRACRYGVARRPASVRQVMSDAWHAV